MVSIRGFHRFSKNLALFALLVSFAAPATAQVSNLTVTATSKPCSATGNMIDFTNGYSSCTATATKWETKIYEMGVCSAHPFGTAKTGVSLDAAKCEVFYAEKVPSNIDIAKLIGTSSNLSGTSTLPPEGKYSHVYVAFGSVFTSAGDFTHNGTKYYNIVNGDAGTSGAADDHVTAYKNFGAPGSCVSGYVGGQTSGGEEMDIFLTNVQNERSPTNGDLDGSNNCAKNDKIIVVVKAATPAVITPKTYSIKFNFKLTGGGVSFSDDDCPVNGGGGCDGIPEDFGLGAIDAEFIVIGN